MLKENCCYVFFFKNDFKKKKKKKKSIKLFIAITFSIRRIEKNCSSSFSNVLRKNAIF